MPMDRNSLNRFRVKVFYALSDSIRLKIIEYLANEERCVCEIISYLKIPQPIISRHLKILKDCGIVKDRRDGTRRFYSITDKRIFGVIDAVSPKVVESLSQHVIEQII
jgi:ArsR family transcriptional regulator